LTEEQQYAHTTLATYRHNLKEKRTKAYTQKQQNTTQKKNLTLPRYFYSLSDVCEHTRNVGKTERSRVTLHTNTNTIRQKRRGVLCVNV
jgi:hypothetical protein